MIVILAALGVTGCASAPKKVGSHRVAAVVIKDSSPEAIKASAKDVFEKHGFDSIPDDDNELVFQKKGSGMNTLFYGDWYSGPVWARAKLFINERKPGEILLDADVYMVQEAEDPLFETSRKVHASKKQFQKLLEEIQADVEGKK